MVLWAVVVLCLALAVPVRALSDAVEIPIDVLVYFESPEGPGGAAIPTIVGVGPNLSGRTRVGFFEDVSMGTGAMWRTAGWMAAVVGAYTQRTDLSGYTIYFDVAGLIDGPSAGALMTVAVLAGMRGDTLLPHATMTGTVNPDGTIGPVGGIYQKIRGAAEVGKTLVLIPLGKRFEPISDHEMADLVAHGRELGVDVQEVGDIFAAYRLLTGQELMAPAVGASTALPEASFQALVTAYETWRGRYQEVENDFSALGLTVPEALQRDARQAQQSLIQGLAAVAYDRITTAYMQARLEYLGEVIVQQLTTAGWEPTYALVAEQEQVIADIDGFFGVLNQTQPAHMGEVPGLLGSYALAAQAYGCYLLAEQHREEFQFLAGLVQELRTPQLGVYLDDSYQIYGAYVADIEPRSPAEAAGLRQGDIIVKLDRHEVDSGSGLVQLLQQLPPAEYQLLVTRAPNYWHQEVLVVDLRADQDEELLEAAVQRLAETVMLYELAAFLIDSAADVLRLGRGSATVGPPDLEQVENLGRLLQSGAAAGMEYFDANVLSPAAKQLGMHPDRFRWQFMSVDYHYALTHANAAASRVIGGMSPYALLGSSAALFHDTGHLTAKYYGLGAETDDEGTIVAIQNERALVHMLELASRQALGAIAEAQRRGIEPTVSLMSYEIALYLREQTLDDKLIALQMFWNATFLAQTLVILCEHAGPYQEEVLPADIETEPAPDQEVFLTLEAALTNDCEIFDDSTYYQVFELAAAADGPVTIRLSSSDFRPYLMILAADGTLLAEGGASDAEPDSIALQCSVPGGTVLLVVANTVYPNQTGPYQIRITGASVKTPEGELIHP